MGPGLPKVTPSHGKDQWSSAPAAACLFSCLNFIFSSCVYLVKNANPATLISYSHRDDGWIACLPTACNTSWATAKGLSTFLHPPPVPGRVPFPSWWTHISVSHPNVAMLFPKKLFAAFQASPSAVICLHLCKMGCFFTGHCRVRPSMLVVLWNQCQEFCGKARKDFGCIIPCHEVPRYMRSASSVTASWLVQRGTMAAMTGKVWNQKNRTGVTRDYSINKKDCFPQNIGYDGFAVASSRQTLVRQHCPTQDVGVGKWLSMKLCNKIYHRTLESEKHWL